MTAGRTDRRRRGASLFAGLLLLTAISVALAGVIELSERAQRRHGAEAVAQRIDSLAWHLDHWLHDVPAFTVAAPTAPRALTAAETARAVSAPFAAPWLLTSDAVSVAATAPASADWHVRFAVGWPSGSNPSAAGTGPPYGVVVALALTDRARRQSHLVKAALRRLGSGVPSAEPGATPPAAGAAAVEIADAAGFTVDGDDVALLSWRHGRISPGIALRRPRAGFPPPGMATEFVIAGTLDADRLLVAGDARLEELDGPRADLEAGSAAVGEVRVTAGLEVEADITVGGDLTVGSLDAERFESPTSRVESTGASTFRLAEVGGDGSAASASVQAARVVQLLDADTLDAGRISGLDLETPFLDLSGGGTGARTRVIDRFYSRQLRLTGGLDVSAPGGCRGCLSNP